jgi:thioesterase domain-containing protein/acyl carrier protein
VVIARRETWADPRATVALVADAGVTALSASSSFLALLLEEPGFSRCRSVRIVTSGTDAMSAGLCERFFAVSSADLYNGYGPSEATIVVTAHRCVPADMHSHEATVPLGHALPNTHVSVRDERLIPVAPGCVGEIVIGGVQLANGYVNRPAETAARFVADPLRPDRRLYRTGDLARVMHDGSIVFLGRNDKQVKVRGQRVEPAEVAAAIERLEGVRTAVVLPRRCDPADPSGSVTLVAYIAPRAGAVVRPAELRSALRMELPDAMVPAEIVIVDAFPLTLTGKIDERALSEREAVVADAPAPVLQTSAESLRGILHEQVRVLWEEVLGRGGIGDHDDFYDLGGDSLLAVRLMLRLEETFGRAVSFAEVFTTMTIAGIGEVLSSSSLSEERPATLSNEGGSLPPLVFLHGDQAGGMYAWMLAKSLGADQPMLVIPPHGMRGRPPATDVPRMAADVAAIVERFFPAGPIRIAGYSVAGLVAYEAARALTAAGRDVLDVVIIGVGAERVSFAGFSAALLRVGLSARMRDALLRVVMGTALRAERFVRTTPDERWARIGRVLRRKGSNAAANALDAIEQSDAYADYLRTHQTYIPGRFGGRVAILWPDEQPVENGELERDWRRAAPRARVIPVPGTHQKAVSRHIRELAGVMQTVFSEATV